jgi:hypothetical protein
MRVLLPLAVAGLMLCGPTTAGVLHPNDIPQMVAQCKAQPETLWCLAREDSRARIMWTGKTDPAQDEWHSSADVVLVDHEFADDCDGLAMTTVDLLQRNNYPVADLFLMLVSVSGKGVDHMVGAAKGADGKLWIVGDAMTQGIYPMDQMKWKLLAIMPVALGLWIVPEGGEG